MIFTENQIRKFADYKTAQEIISLLDRDEGDEDFTAKFEEELVYENMLVYKFRENNDYLFISNGYESKIIDCSNFDCAYPNGDEIIIDALYKQIVIKIYTFVFREEKK